MQYDKEFRQYEFSEIRAEQSEADPGQPKKLVGYAARFDTYSHDLGGFREIIRKGAFRENLGANPVFALANHERNLILGSTKNKSLQVSEDQYGLRMDLSPIDTSTAQEWVRLVELGIIDKMSFAFQVDGPEGEHWYRDEKGYGVRELLKIKVFDVSLVNNPAYEATGVGFRSLEEVRAYGESVLSKDKQVIDLASIEEVKRKDEHDRRRRYIRLLELR